MRRSRSTVQRRLRTWVRRLARRARVARAVVQTSPDAVIVLGPDWSILEGSPGAGPLALRAGLTHSPASTATQVVWADVLGRAFRGEPVDFTFVADDREWNVRVRPVGGGRVVIHGRDVTERRIAERGRDAAFGRFDALLEALSEATVALDCDLRVVAANDACGHVLGLPVPKHGSDATAWIPELSDALAKIYRRALGGRTVRESLEWRRAGAAVTLHITASPVRGRDAVVGVIVNVQAADALPRDRSRLHLLEAVPDLVAIMRRDGSIAELKPAQEPSHGPTADELDAAKLRPRLEEAFRTKKLVTYDYEVAVGGAPQVREARLSALDDDEAVLLVRDVTEQRRLVSALYMSDRMASLGTLAAGVAHELNNPLAYVTSNLTFLEEELRRDLCDRGPSKATDDRLAAIVESREGAERMAVIVKDLKAFSHPAEPTVADVDANAVLDSVLEIVRTSLRHKGELLKSYGAVGLVRCNEARLSQIFLNLMVNAVQALDEHRKKENVIRIRTGMREHRVFVEVADNGPGIPAALRGRIFDPFFTTKAQGEGTGLGLSISLGLARGMGGDIELESVEGTGSLFRVVLPCASPVVETRTRYSSGKLPVARAHLLLVDDDALVLSSLRKLLREHDVDVASSAREALVKIEHGASYDLILCDMMMPEMTGADFLRSVRERWPKIEGRIVLMTGGAVTSEAQRFVDQCGWRVLEKPFTRDAVRSCLARAREDMLTSA